MMRSQKAKQSKVRRVALVPNRFERQVGGHYSTVCRGQAMFCGISGEVPTQGVISKKTGLLFEKRLIEKHLEYTKTCPVTNQEMQLDDLIEVKANKAVKPRQISSTSIPGLLNAFQNEWDEMALETFTLKQHLDATRQELSQALYQHDAACRVIARLVKERDEARAMLTNLQQAGFHSTAAGANAGNENGGANEMEIQDQSSSGFSANVLEKINNKATELSSTRRGRKPSENLATKDQLASSYAPKESFNPHKAAKPGITCVAVRSDASSGEELILTGGVDKDVLLSSGKLGGKFKASTKITGHSKTVNAVAFHPHNTDTVFSASADGTVKIWGGDTSKGYSEKLTYTNDDEVTGLSVHPTGAYLASVSLDGSWSFLDIERGQDLITVYGTSKDLTKTSEKHDPYHSCAFHPDGLLLGACTGGNSNAMRIWDLREQTNVAVMAEHTAQINSLSFSENGYLVATGSADGSVKIWDLRKLKCTSTIESMKDAGSINSVAFEYAGLYLAMASDSRIEVTVTKEWTPLATFNKQTKPVTGVAWGPDASYLCSTSMDKTVVLYH